MGYLDRALVSRKISSGYGRRRRSASKRKPFIAHALRAVDMFQWEDSFTIGLKRCCEPSEEIVKTSKCLNQSRILYLWVPLCWTMVRLRAACHLFCPVLSTEQTASLKMNHKSEQLDWKTLPYFLTLFLMLELDLNTSDICKALRRLSSRVLTVHCSVMDYFTVLLWWTNCSRPNKMWMIFSSEIAEVSKRGSFWILFSQME